MSEAGFRSTRKQREIIDIILKAADGGEILSIRDIHERISYTCSFPAVVCSLTFLERHGFVVKERGAKNRTYLKPTLLAYQRFRPGP
jgi:Fe2+ or Zn2+ uptake regulation protein